MDCTADVRSPLLRLSGHVDTLLGTIRITVMLARTPSLSTEGAPRAAVFRPFGWGPASAAALATHEPPISCSPGQERSLRVDLRIGGAVGPGRPRSLRSDCLPQRLGNGRGGGCIPGNGTASPRI